MRGRFRSTSRLVLIAALAAFVFATTGCLRSPEEKYAAFMESGKEYMENEDYDSAVLQFRSAAQVMPEDAEAHYQAALAELRRGNGTQAYQLSRKVEQLDRNHKENQMLLAQLMVLISQREPDFMDEAAKRLAALRNANPQDADVLYLLAATKARVGNSDEMQEFLVEALKASPQHLQSSLALAQAKLVERDFEGAEQVLKQAVAEAPDSVHPILALGQLYLVLNRAEEARAQFARALEMEPNTPQAIIGTALIAERAGQADEAERLMQKASTLGDKRYQAFYGRILLQHEKWDAAIEEFRRLVAAQPRDAELRGMLLATYLRAERPNEAEAFLKQVIAEQPDDRNSRKQLVGLLVALNRTPEAEEILNEAIAKNPQDADALLQRTEIYWRAGRIHESEQDLVKILQSRPTSHEAHFFQAMLHQSRGQTRLHQQELTEAVRLEPNFLLARVELANTMRNSGERGDVQAALNLLDDAPDASKRTLAFAIARNWALIQTNHPDARSSVDRTLQVSQAPEVLLQDGALKLQAKQFAAARGVFESVLQQEPENVRALGALVQSYVLDNQQARATEAIQKYVDARPRSAALQNFAGQWYTRTGDRGAARQAYSAALESNPDSTPARLAVAQLDLAEGNHAAAREGFMAILTANPSHVQALIYLSMTAEATGNHQGAIEGYQEALRLNPEGNLAAVAHNNLAYLLAERKNELDEALTHAQRAKELAPTNRQIDDTLGWIYYRKGIYGSALEYLKSAASSESGQNSALIQYHLAICQIKAGEVTQGRATLARAKSLDPNLPEAARADEMLQQLAGQ